jgi:hypothetical protein
MEDTGTQLQSTLTRVLTIPSHIYPHGMHRDNVTPFSIYGFSITGLFKYSVLTAGLT